MALRDDILAADDSKTETITVPEWGGVTVKIRTLTGYERDEFEASNYDSADEFIQRGLRVRLLVRCLTSETGEQLFHENDVDALAQKNGAVLRRLFIVAQKLNGMDKADVEKN